MSVKHCRNGNAISYSYLEDEYQDKGVRLHRPGYGCDDSGEYCVPAVERTGVLFCFPPQL